MNGLKTRQCIWCSRKVPEVEFKKKAHTIPKSLGGKNICLNVCDGCNSYFGNVNDKLPSIETTLKESFNISRLMYLYSDNEVGRNKALARFKSIFFTVNLKKRKIMIKPGYRLKQDFQVNLARQLKRGIFKVFLEERERQFGDAHNSKFDFIREFSRYNLGDYPVYYYKRKFGAILMIKEFGESPELFMKKDYRMKYLIDNNNFFEFELLGHVIGIPTSKYYQLTFDLYVKETRALKKDLFDSFRPIIRFSDFDLSLSILED
ncbi:HNH endonuclease [Flavobacteriaceae bacterium 3-367]